MADHTLLMGVQAALDRRLRNRALDLQSQVAESQMGDRDQREQDMRMKIVQQHNDAAAARAAKAGQYDPRMDIAKLQADQRDAASRRESEQRDAASKRQWEARDQMDERGWSAKEGMAGGKNAADVVRSEGNDTARVKGARIGADAVVRREQMGIDAGKYVKAPHSGGGGHDLSQMTYTELLKLEQKSAESLDKMRAAIAKGDQNVAMFGVPASGIKPEETNTFLNSIRAEIKRRGEGGKTPASETRSRVKNP